MSDFDILQEEITTDPMGIGYSGMTPEQIYTALTVENRTRNKSFMFGYEIWENTDSAEYASKTAEAKREWLALCAIERVNPFGAAQQVAIGIFGNPASSVTVANLQAARVETLSRMKMLGIQKVSIGLINEVLAS